MTQLFAKYPAIRYTINDAQQNILCRDIMQRVKMRDFLANNYLIFYPYTIKDGDTPEIIAAKLYNSPNYHWIVLLVNTVLDPYYDWPLSTPNLIATIRKRYSTQGIDGLYYAQTNNHHYQDLNGNTIDQTTFSGLDDDQRIAVSIYDWEVARNEAKRQIRLLDAQFVQQIDQEMNALMVSPVA